MTGELRASDRERDRAAERLRESCVAGRLTLAELEERLEGVTAVTVGELEELVGDLPSSTVRDEPGRDVHGAPPKPGPVGVLPFTHTVFAPVAPGEVRRQLLLTVARRLADHGYHLVSQAPAGLTFECNYRPPWTILVALLAFPIGLIALASKRDERILISLEERPGGQTDMIVHGTPRAGYARLSSTCGSRQVPRRSAAAPRPCRPR